MNAKTRGACILPLIRVVITYSSYISTPAISQEVSQPVYILEAWCHPSLLPGVAHLRSIREGKGGQHPRGQHPLQPSLLNTPQQLAIQLHKANPNLHQEALIKLVSKVLSRTGKWPFVQPKHGAQIRLMRR